jgi:hypothetical protein
VAEAMQSHMTTAGRRLLEGYDAQNPDDEA